MFRAKRPTRAEIPKPKNGREFTTTERAKIAVRYDQLAADFLCEQRALDARGPKSLAPGELEYLAIDAEAVAKAARMPNRVPSEVLTYMLHNLRYLHR